MEKEKTTSSMGEPICPTVNEQPLKEEEPTKNKNMKGKNYTFNNCTVTINEEGKAIDVLKQEADNDKKRQEALSTLFSLFSSIATHYLTKKIEAQKENKEQPKVVTPTKKAKKKTKPTKKKVVKKVIRKKK